MFQGLKFWRSCFLQKIGPNLLKMIRMLENDIPELRRPAIKNEVPLREKFWRRESISCPNKHDLRDIYHKVFFWSSRTLFQHLFLQFRWNIAYRQNMRSQVAGVSRWCFGSRKKTNFLPNLFLSKQLQFWPIFCNSNPFRQKMHPSSATYIDF